jgi:hypothetical protein
MYRCRTELLEAAQRILNSELPAKNEAYHARRGRLAGNLARCQTLLHFSEWDRVPDWQRRSMIDSFIGKYSLKPGKKPANPDEAQKLLEEHYLSYEHDLGELYRHRTGLLGSEVMLSRMGPPEPMTDLTGQAFIPFNGSELI